ncbi:hypothetical protein M427DRAFT_36368 [Gonapodya prolifera JEL478]|uniref:RRM domain-containing protein n=1 Tax=Gonapodya prolifera (strain JEL478) TaxID=1344416 RepID=A0A139A344_GONPJ|nr:hypothetical protein M427DRAFT_36368 [Gonapodya prolifera JEL478]|eukprot:KXS11048.1 hypothetical protein M427DRAFT_36368 [Gonapodya prolifera JEL478]
MLADVSSAHALRSLASLSPPPLAAHSHDIPHSLYAPCTPAIHRHRDVHAGFGAGTLPTRSTPDPIHPPDRAMERPSRTVFVRCIANHTPASAVRAVFEACGDVKCATSVIERKGIMFVTYYDIRCAQDAVRELNGYVMDGRAWDCHFSLPKGGPDTRVADEDENQGTVFVKSKTFQPLDNSDLFNFMSRFGHVKAVRDVPSGPHEKIVEFYDSRHALTATTNTVLLGVRGIPVHAHYAGDVSHIHATTPIRHAETIPGPGARHRRDVQGDMLAEAFRRAQHHLAPRAPHEGTRQRAVDYAVSLGFPGPLSAPSSVRDGVGRRDGDGAGGGWPALLQQGPKSLLGVQSGQLGRDMRGAQSGALGTGFADGGLTRRDALQRLFEKPLFLPDIAVQSAGHLPAFLHLRHPHTLIPRAAETGGGFA